MSYSTENKYQLSNEVFLIDNVALLRKVKDHVYAFDVNPTLVLLVANLFSRK